jgi:hypothetical protein
VGNEFSHLILAPSVPDDAIEAFALFMRRRASRPGQLYLKDLAGRRVRKLSLIAARDAGVRLLEYEGTSTDPRTEQLRAAEATLGAGRFLYREQDDEETDICMPDPSWLVTTFGREDLGFLLELEEEPVPWNVRPYFIYPRVPDDWPIDLPLNPSFLVVAKPGEPRACPICGDVGVSKGLRRHCPVCSYIFEPFLDPADAQAIVPIPGDAFRYGQCPRCMASFAFSRRVQQCLRCGRLLRISGGRHEPWDMPDNEAAIRQRLATVALKPQPLWRRLFQ